MNHVCFYVGVPKIWEFTVLWLSRIVGKENIWSMSRREVLSVAIVLSMVLGSISIVSAASRTQRYKSYDVSVKV